MALKGTKKGAKKHKEDNEAVKLLAAMIKAFGEHEGPLNKDAFFNGAMMAAMEMETETRDALLEEIKAQPKDALKNLNQSKKEEEAKALDLVAAPIAFGLKEYGIAYIKEEGIPLVINYFVPGGGGVITKKMIIPAAEITSRFAVTVLNDYLGQVIKKPKERLVGMVGSAVTSTTEGVYNLFRRTPAEQPRLMAPQARAALPALASVEPERMARTPAVVINVIPKTISLKRKSSVVIEEIQNDEEAKKPQKPKGKGGSTRS